MLKEVTRNLFERALKAEMTPGERTSKKEGYQNMKYQANRNAEFVPVLVMPDTRVSSSDLDKSLPICKRNKSFRD